MWLWIVAVAGSFATAGCGLFDDPTPERATVMLGGDSGTPVEIIVSTRFLAGVTETGVTQVELLTADTLLRPLPFDTTYSIRTDQRFFVRVARADTVDAQLQMSVLVDERERFRRDAPIANGPFTFVFRFNEPTTAIIEVI